MSSRAPLPDEALAALATGRDRWDELRAEGCEMHFELGPDGRLRAELRDLDGGVLRPLSPGEALAVAVPDPPAA